MTKKCKLIDDLMYSSRNVTTVKFNDQFKDLVSFHKKQLMKLCEVVYTIGSKKLKMTINQDPVEVH